MLYHPEFDPIALQIGPLAVRWYGLMYLIGFGLGLTLGRLRIRANQNPSISIRQFDDLLFYIILGVILGGRLGYSIFYDLTNVIRMPISVFYVWEGGMSFHGGLIGVCVAVAMYARQKKQNWLVLTDFIAPLVPLGLAAGRIGNFINGELWGRPTDVPWAMVFPQSGSLVGRHPSQLYEFFLEGDLRRLELGSGDRILLDKILDEDLRKIFVEDPDDDRATRWEAGLTLGVWAFFYGFKYIFSYNDSVICISLQ